MEKYTQDRRPPPGAYRSELDMYRKVVGRGSKHPIRGLPKSAGTSPHSPLRTSPHSPLRTSPHSPLRDQSCQGRNAASPCAVFHSIDDTSPRDSTPSPRIPSPPALRKQLHHKVKRGTFKKGKKVLQQAAHTSGTNASGTRSTATSGAGALGAVGGGSAASLTIFAGGFAVAASLLYFGDRHFNSRGIEDTDQTRKSAVEELKVLTNSEVWGPTGEDSANPEDPLLQFLSDSLSARYDKAKNYRTSQDRRHMSHLVGGGTKAALAVTAGAAPPVAAVLGGVVVATSAVMDPHGPFRDPKHCESMLSKILCPVDALRVAGKRRENEASLHRELFGLIKPGISRTGCDCIELACPESEGGVKEAYREYLEAHRGKEELAKGSGLIPDRMAEVERPADVGLTSGSNIIRDEKRTIRLFHAIKCIARYHLPGFKGAFRNKEFKRVIDADFEGRSKGDPKTMDVEIKSGGQSYTLELNYEEYVEYRVSMYVISGSNNAKSNYQDIKREVASKDEITKKEYDSLASKLKAAAKEESRVESHLCSTLKTGPSVASSIKNVPNMFYGVGRFHSEVQTLLAELKGKITKDDPSLGRRGRVLSGIREGS